LLTYGNTLNNGYVLDDHNLILNNSQVTHGISSVVELVTTRLREGSDMWEEEVDALLA